MRAESGSWQDILAAQILYLDPQGECHVSTGWDWLREKAAQLDGRDLETRLTCTKERTLPAPSNLIRLNPDGLLMKPDTNRFLLSILTL